MLLVCFQFFASHWCLVFVMFRTNKIIFYLITTIQVFLELKRLDSHGNLVYRTSPIGPLISKFQQNCFTSAYILGGRVGWKRENRLKKIKPKVLFLHHLTIVE